MMSWKCGRFDLTFEQPKVMGIVNMTPDSFSDGGTYSVDIKTALNHAETLLKDGADILDIGGESSRPGADFVSPQDEWERVKNILKEIITWNVPITLDTRRTYVMQKALDADLVDAINDIEALQDDGALELLAQNPNIGICLMHMQGQPENMQDNPQYDDVIENVKTFLQSRIDLCRQHNINDNRILLDPGIGFGKTVEHNLALLKNPQLWQPEKHFPYLIGVSRKSLIGHIINEKNPKNRITASVVAAILSIQKGANIVRVHDVRETVEAIKIMNAYQ